MEGRAARASGPQRSRSSAPSAGAGERSRGPRAQRRGGGGATGGRRLGRPRDEPEGGGVGPAPGAEAWRPRACRPADLAAPPPQVKGPELPPEPRGAPGAAPGQPVLVQFIFLMQKRGTKDVCLQEFLCVRARSRRFPQEPGARVAVLYPVVGHSWPCPGERIWTPGLEMSEEGMLNI